MLIILWCTLADIEETTQLYLAEEEKKEKRKKSVLTEVPHTFLVRVIQEKIALLYCPVDLKAKSQASILH